MKSLKYVIVSLVLALGFAAPAVNAQDAAPKSGKQGRERPDVAAAWLKDITLTADQQTKVDAIKSAGQKQLQGLPQEERRAKAREVMQDSQKKIREVLTADQQAKFDANVKAAQQRGGGKGDKGGKGGDKGGKGGKTSKAAPDSAD